MLTPPCPHTMIRALNGGRCVLCPAAPDLDDLGELDAAALERDLERSILADSFGAFVAAAFPLVAGRAYAPNVASEAIIEHLQAVADGKLRRLAVAVAPGLGKSTIISVLYPAWRWTRDPAWRVITASHAHDLAVTLARKARALVGGEWFRAMFPHVTLGADRADHYETARGGHRIAVGVGGGLTGFRAHETICDDSLNAVDARSEATRAAVNVWYDEALSTRLDDPDRAAQIVVQQRLHSDDLVGHLAEQGGWEMLVLPSEFDPARRTVTSIWTDPRTEDGELVASQIHSAEHLAERKVTLGSAAYSCQYLQDPTDAEGGLFQRGWWKFHKPDGRAADGTRRPLGCSDVPAVPLPSSGRVVVSLDAAFKDLKTSDNVCFLVALLVGAERYILERRWGKMSFTRTKEVVRELAATYRGAVFLVEDKANGTAIIDELKLDVPNLIAISPRESKESRAAAVSPTVEAGQVFLPDGVGWLESFVDELAAFPRGKADDQVDALTQLLNWARTPIDDEEREAFRGALQLCGSFGDAPMTLSQIEAELAEYDRRRAGVAAAPTPPPVDDRIRRELRRAGLPPDMFDRARRRPTALEDELDDLAWRSMSGSGLGGALFDAPMPAPPAPPSERMGVGRPVAGAVVPEPEITAAMRAAGALATPDRRKG